MASVENYYGAKYGPLPITEGAGTQAFKAGDLVKYSSGTAVIATAGAIDGIAAVDAVGTTSSEISYYPIDFDAIYVAKYKASATSVALIGVLLDFTFTAGAHTLDESGATTDVYCVGLDPRDPVGTSGGRLLVKFVHAATLAA